MLLPSAFFNQSEVKHESVQMPTSILKKEIFLKFFLILGFFLLTYCFLLLFSHQSQGYVVDIYSELPLIFFISLIFCFAIGSATLFLSQGITRKLGILLLIFTYSAVLVIPYMLSYYSMGRADDMSYIGEYLQIRNSGNIAGWDVYPASHILGAALSLGTGAAPHIVSFIIPFLFSFLFVAGCTLCCRYFLNDDQMIVNVAIPSSLILYLGPYNFLNVPHALFFALMPLFLWILFRFIKGNQNFSDIILLFPFTFLVPFMHPFIVFFVIITLLTMIIMSPFLERFVHLNYNQVIVPLLIILTGFFAWFLNGTKLLGNFKTSYLSYVYKVTEPVFFETSEKLARINIDYFKIFKLLTLFYGRYIIPSLVIVLALIIIYIKRNSISQDFKNRIVILAFFYIVFFAIEVILFFNPIISHQPDRLVNLNFIVYAQVPLFVYSLYMIFIKFKPSSFKILVLLILLSGIWGLSLFGSFDSPNIFRTNVALTNNEVQGMKWFYEVRITEIVIVPLSQIDRFHDLFADSGADKRILPQFHFGYLNSDRSFVEIHSIMNKQFYVVLLTTDELLYQKVPGYIEVGRYNAADFQRFRNDNSIKAKIYESRNIQIFFVS